MIPETSGELFTLSEQGAPFRCSCRANVFYKPDPHVRPLVYACNACGQWYQGEPVPALASLPVSGERDA